MAKDRSSDEGKSCFIGGVGGLVADLEKVVIRPQAENLEL